MALDNKSTVFAGAGAGEGQNAGRYRPGLLRLRPGAGDWEFLSSGLPENVEVRCIAQNPTDPRTIFVGTQDGPYRSKDGGDTWQRPDFPVDSAVIWSVAVHPTKPNIVYCGAAPVAVYRSTDGGDSWRHMPQVVSPSHCEREGFDSRTISVTFNPIHPDEIYVGLEVSGALRSIDAGESWQDVSSHLMELAQLPHLQSNVGGRDCGVCEGMLDTHAMVISRAAPEVVFLGIRMGIFQSRDGGTTWQDTEVGKHSPITYCRDVIVSPHDPKVFYAALSKAAFSTEGALYRSDDIAQTWTRIDHGVTANSTIMSLAAHPSDPAVLYSVTRMGQVIGTEDGGKNWQEIPLPEGVSDVYAVACL
ncbi:MAG: hypothetical protein VW709_12235 [Rickettsiales bacterium]